MKTIVAGVALAMLAAGVAYAQPRMHEHEGPVCLWTYRIDHTHTVNPNTVLFYMKNGDVWKNTLAQPCRGLMFNGFAYVTQDGSICDNMQSIIVLRSHEVCQLGAFTPAPREKPHH